MTDSITFLEFTANHQASRAGRVTGDQRDNRPLGLADNVNPGRCDKLALVNLVLIDFGHITEIDPITNLGFEVQRAK